jgi:hypothetical protein
VYTEETSSTVSHAVFTLTTTCFLCQLSAPDLHAEPSDTFYFFIFIKTRLALTLVSIVLSSCKGVRFL